jgi:hypothetical protein
MVESWVAMTAVVTVEKKAVTSVVHLAYRLAVM